MSTWSCVLQLDEQQNITSGSEAALCAAIRNGADLRVGTTFRHSEHIDRSSTNAELIREQMDFRIVYLLEDRWVAAIQNLRMPIDLPNGFGPRASMSFFMYNQDGGQALARPHLDGPPVQGEKGLAATPTEDQDLPKYHRLDHWDEMTNAPSRNFIYDFDTFRFHVRDHWRRVYEHDAAGCPVFGSVDDLADASARGAQVKVAIAGLCDDLTPDEGGVAHEVFVHGGSCYYYTERKHFMVAAHPLIRVSPTIPMRYRSGNWDFGWTMPRTDGFVSRWLCDPYTLQFNKSEGHYAMRWFVDG